VLWSGVLKAGESTRIQSPLPVSVVVGRAQVVTATLRGQPFDLKPHTQVTVARFEVKE
jgi:cytoskeleton protein RodZ